MSEKRPDFTDVFYARAKLRDCVTKGLRLQDAGDHKGARGLQRGDALGAGSAAAGSGDQAEGDAVSECYHETLEISYGVWLCKCGKKFTIIPTESTAAKEIERLQVENARLKGRYLTLSNRLAGMAALQATAIDPEAGQ